MESTTIVEVNPQDNTAGIVTTKFLDKVEAVPNLIGTLKSQVEDINKKIEDAQLGIEQLNASVNARKQEFQTLITSLQDDKEVIVQKIADAVDAGIVEVAPEITPE